MAVNKPIQLISRSNLSSAGGSNKPSQAQIDYLPAKLKLVLVGTWLVSDLS